ncbi:MAG: phage scaffolding protein [Oscillospiraceae bacterium]
MDRKFLKDLGLDKELVDKILDEAGKDVESHKEEVSDLKTQLKTAQDTLKSFDGVDVGELKGKITELTNSLATKDTEYQQKMADIEFNKTVDLSIAAFGARNAKTVKALLDVDTLKDSKNQESDIRTALEAVKKENDYLFQT